MSSWRGGGGGVLKAEERAKVKGLVDRGERWLSVERSK